MGSWRYRQGGGWHFLISRRILPIRSRFSKQAGPTNGATSNGRIAMRAAQVLPIGFVAAALNVVLMAEGWSQTYPGRTIQLIVAYAAGGTGDIVARSVADKLGAALGQSVVVENRAGASGAIGAHSVTSASPDGY